MRHPINLKPTVEEKTKTLQVLDTAIYLNALSAYIEPGRRKSLQIVDKPAAVAARKPDEERMLRPYRRASDSEQVQQNANHRFIAHCSCSGLIIYLSNLSVAALRGAADTRRWVTLVCARCGAASGRI